MTIQKKHKRLYIIAIVLVVIVSLILILQLIFSGIVKNKIERALDEKDQSKYQIELRTAKVNLFTMTLILKDIQITPDSAYKEQLLVPEIKTNSVVRANIRDLRIRNIDVISIIQNKFVEIGEIIIGNAKVDVFTAHKKVDSEPSTRKPSHALFNLDSIVMPGMLGGLIDKLNLSKFEIVVHKYEDSDTVFYGRSINLSLEDISLTKNESDSTSFRLKLNDANISLTDEKFNLPGGKYALSFKEFNYNLVKKKLVFNKLKIKPRYSRDKMVSFSKFQYEIYDVDIHEVVINSLNLSQMIRESKFYLTSVDVDGMRLSIFKDKRHPFDESKRPKLPHVLIKGLKQDLNIDSINISNSELIYAERHDLMKELMKVTLGDFNVKIRNVTSVADSIINGAVMSINLRANLQDVIPMGVDMIFPMKSIQDTFMFSGYLDKGDMKIFNSVVLPVMGVKFDSGDLDKITFSANANPTYSIGTMTMLYHDLQGNVQKQDMVESNRFLTWVANAVIIRNNPVKDKDPRTVPLYFERVVYKGMGNYLWKTIQSGITATIIPTMKNKVQGQIDETLGTDPKVIKKRERQEKRAARKNRK